MFSKDPSVSDYPHYNRLERTQNYKRVLKFRLQHLETQLVALSGLMMSIFSSTANTSLDMIAVFRLAWCWRESQGRLGPTTSARQFCDTLLLIRLNKINRVDLSRAYSQEHTTD